MVCFIYAIFVVVGLVWLDEIVCSKRPGKGIYVYLVMCTVISCLCRTNNSRCLTRSTPRRASQQHICREDCDVSSALWFQDVIALYRTKLSSELTDIVEQNERFESRVASLEADVSVWQEKIKALERKGNVTNTSCLHHIPSVHVYVIFTGRCIMLCIMSMSWSSTQNCFLFTTNKFRLRCSLHFACFKGHTLCYMYS